jgi:hypothetical protein
MPFLASVEGFNGYGRGFITQQNVLTPIVSGNLAITMNSNGFTAIPGVAGQDDAFGPIPTDSTLPFYFFGTNYGSGSNAPNGIYWNTNNVVGFGLGNGTITWVANTGRGILFGNLDRRTDPDAYYSAIQTSGTYKILTCLMYFRNIYNAGVAGEGQFRLRFARDTIVGNQFIECCVFKGSPSVNGGAITSTGAWNLTNGTAFQNTFGTVFNTTFPAGNTSFVLSSDPLGNTWSFSNTSYLNL